MSDMTPEQKWKRLTNPQTVDDYAIRMTAERVRYGALMPERELPK